MKVYFMLAFTIIISKTVNAQEVQATSAIDYSLSPVPDEGAFMQVLKIGAGLNIALGELQIQPGLGLRDYDFTNANYDALAMDFRLSNFYTSLGIAFPLMASWSFKTYGETSWAAGLNFNKTVLKGGAYFSTINTFFQTPTTLEFGLAYETYLGKPEVLPTINLQFSVKDFSFQAGFPQSSITYSINNHNSLTAGYFWKGDYLYLPEPSLSYLPTETAALQTQKASLSYTHDLDKNWSFHMDAGYLISNKLKLYDDHKLKILDVDMGKSPIFYAGIKFNISNFKN